MKRILVCLFALMLALPREAKAEPLRELIMSSAYGVLAGTLVGAATLAFTERPGDNLRNIARGASLGLYAGILLGLYVVYVVPGENDEEEPEGDVYPSPESSIPMVYPILGDNNSVEGAGVAMKVLSF
jgi:hypothetical protein